MICWPACDAGGDRLILHGCDAAAPKSVPCGATSDEADGEPECGAQKEHLITLERPDAGRSRASLGAAELSARSDNSIKLHRSIGGVSGAARGWSIHCLR